MSETLLGVIIGGLLVTASNVVVAIIQGNRESDLDKQKRADERRIERDRMQRDWLLELQERLAEWMRTLGEMHHADVLGMRADGKLHLYPADLSDREMIAGRKVMYLAE